MARNSAETVFTGSAGELLQAYQEIREANRRMEQQMRELRRESREAHREEQQGLREAQQMYREVRTPLERYREEVQRVEKAYESGNIDVDTRNRQLALQKRRLDETTQSGNAAATAIKGFVAGFAGLAGIQKMLQVIRAELENIHERQANAASTQLQVAEAERNALLNFGPQRGQELITMARQVQDKTGGGYIGILNAISESSSKKGTGLTDAQVEDAVTIATRLTPDDPAAIQTGAGAIISQMKVTGGTAAEIAGQQMAAKALSPVVSNQAFAANIAPGAMNLVRLGLTEQQAYGLMAGAGSAVDDATGQTTANAMLNFMTQLKVKAPQFENPFEALDFLRSDAGAKLRSELLGPLERDQQQAERQAAAGGVGLTGEKKFLPFMVEMLQPQQTATQRAVTQSVAGIPTRAAAGPQFETDMAAIEAMPNQRTAALHRRLSAATQNAELFNVEEGRASIAREGMMNFLKASGVSAAGQKFAQARFEASTGFGTQGDAAGFLAEEFSSRATDLRRTKYSAAGVGAPGIAIPPTKQQLEDAKAFEALAGDMSAFQEVGARVGSPDLGVRTAREVADQVPMEGSDISAVVEQLELMRAEAEERSQRPQPVAVEGGQGESPARDQSR